MLVAGVEFVVGTVCVWLWYAPWSGVGYAYGACVGSVGDVASGGGVGARHPAPLEIG